MVEKATVEISLSRPLFEAAQRRSPREKHFEGVSFFSGYAPPYNLVLLTYANLVMFNFIFYWDASSHD